MLAPADARAIVAFGDSITDGTASTMNGDDRGQDDAERVEEPEPDRPLVVGGEIRPAERAAPLRQRQGQTFRHRRGSS